MKRIDSAWNWEMRIGGEREKYKATVPGSVYNDLIKAGRMDDPYYRDNEDAALEMMKNDFVYTGTFAADMNEVKNSDEVLLRFNGLDTLADVFLNGQKRGSTNNMHRGGDFSVKDYLKAIAT